MMMMMMMITTMAKKIRHFFPETREREREKEEEEEEEEKNATRTLSPFLSLSLSLSLSNERRDFLSAQQPQRRIEKKENDKRRLLLRERGPIMKRGLYACPNTSQTLNNAAHKKKKEKKEFNSPERFFVHFCTFLQVKRTHIFDDQLLFDTE